jgi:hypothetical protein
MDSFNRIGDRQRQQFLSTRELTDLQLLHQLKAICRSAYLAPTRFYYFLINRSLSDGAHLTTLQCSFFVLV